MASSVWRPWEHQEQETSVTDETENTLEIWESGKLVKALNMSLRTIGKIVEQGKAVKRGRDKYNRKQNCFSKKDDFLRNLIRQNFYSFHQKKVASKRYAFE